MSVFYASEKYLEIESELEVLTAQVWDHIIGMPEIIEWLEQFNGQVVSEEEEKKYMLTALSKFMFFSRDMIQEMLISLYRDHFKAPLMQLIRRNNNDTLDFSLLNSIFNERLEKTRFIGVGKPAESGTHLLYIFRQVNGLKNSIFSDIHTSFEINNDNGISKWIVKDQNVERYIFFDDFVGGGTQVKRNLLNILCDIKRDNPNLEVSFLSIFSTNSGISLLNKDDLFSGNASCLFELDDTYKSCFSETRYFKKIKDFDVEKFKIIVEHYGKILYPDHPLGYSNCELLIGFEHNTPNNTLPIFWKSDFVESLNKSWFPIFKRFEKNYGFMRS